MRQNTNNPQNIATNYITHDKTCPCGVALDVGRKKYCSDGCMRSNQKQYKYPVNIYYARYHTIKRRAFFRELDFNLAPSDIKYIMSMPCHYCGDHSSQSQVDRKNNLKGYTIDNVVPACRRCNTTKNSYISYEEMLKLVEVLGWKNEN